MKERLALEFPEAGSPEVGRWLAALQDCRRRTAEVLSAVSNADLERPAVVGMNSIGSLLYHVALIEADWLFAEILEGREPVPEQLFPFDVREEGGRLTPVTGMSLTDHLDRLATVRSIVLDELRAMDSGEFHRIRSLPQYDVAPDWVLHHLMQHEAEHRAQIAELMAAAGRSG
jgi:uncharacterized damage-inducible protein DinB